MVDLITEKKGGQDFDSVVIKRVLDALEGGRTLNVTGHVGDYVKAGHVVIKETATGVYKPLGITAGKFVALPAGHMYAGIVMNTKPTVEPNVGVLVQGAVNYVAMPASTEDILEAMTVALININFRKDQE